MSRNTPSNGLGTSGETPETTTFASEFGVDSSGTSALFIETPEEVTNIIAIALKILITKDDNIFEVIGDTVTHSETAGTEG